MIDTLLAHFDASHTDPAEYHILFAGGVHDSLSSLMVASLAAPLAERGVRLGVLMGTAYLFTSEAVSSGAITARYQQEAVKSRQTVLVESGIGHMTRCLPTPFVDAFVQRKRSLLQEGVDGDHLRQELEDLNIGRLRMASKGINRNPDSHKLPGAPAYITLDEQEQYQQGMYMIGQVAGLRDEVCTIEELHQQVSIGGAQRLASLAATVEQPATTWRAISAARPHRDRRHLDGAARRRRLADLLGKHPQQGRCHQRDTHRTFRLAALLRPGQERPRQDILPLGRVHRRRAAQPAGLRHAAQLDSFHRADAVADAGSRAGRVAGRRLSRSPLCPRAHLGGDGSWRRPGRPGLQLRRALLLAAFPVRRVAGGHRPHG